MNMPVFKEYKEVFSLIIDDSNSLRGIGMVMVALIALNAIMGSLSVGVIVPLFQSIIDPSHVSSVITYFGFISSSNSNEDVLIILFGVVLALFFLKFVVAVLAEYISASFKEKLRIVWVERIEKSYLLNQYSTAVSINQGERVNNMLREPFNAANCVKFFVESLMSITIVIGIWITTLYVNWHVSILISFIAVFLGLVQRKLFFNRALDLGDQRVRQWQKVTSHVTEIMGMLREVKILNYENTAVNKTNKLMKKLGKLVIKSTVLTTIPRASAEFITVVFFVIGYLLMVTIYNSSVNEILPYMIFFVVAFGKIIASSFQFITSMLRVLNNLPSLKLMHEIGKDASNLTNQNKAGLPISDICSNIEFSDLCFSYVREKPIFNNFNLTIPHGKVTFLIGPSGSGKSTLVDLICGLYEPDSGGLFINGVPLKSYKESDWRKIIGYVSQEDKLINGTIKDNIMMNNKSASSDDIIGVTKIAGVHDYISTLNDAYDTNIGENGIALSGGQKKRIAIARALINRPQFVIFDEATSNVENKIEYEILKKLTERSGSDITVIVITHRLANINLADRVYVLNKGEVVHESRYSTIYSDDEVSLLHAAK